MSNPIPADLLAITFPMEEFRRLVEAANNYRDMCRTINGKAQIGLNDALALALARREIAQINEMRR